MIAAISGPGFVTEAGEEEAGPAPAAGASILILEDRLLFRECLAAAVAAVWPNVCVHAARLGDGHRLPEQKVDLILLSTAGERRADQIAYSVQRALRDDPGAALVVLTDSAEDRIVEAAKRGGAQGLATTSGTDVRGTISILKRVKMGEAAFPGPGPASKAAPPASSVPDPRPKPLADDERAFLSALATGKSNRMIAADLGLSEIAVKLEVRRLLREHQLGHRAQLVLLVKSLATAEGQG